jgi:hypothetical protein
MELALSTTTVAAAIAVATTGVAATAGLGTLRLASLAARGAPLWLGEAALCVEILLTSGERKLAATVATRQRSITHSV